jgi:hypothetical protein
MILVPPLALLAALAAPTPAPVPVPSAAPTAAPSGVPSSVPATPAASASPPPGTVPSGRPSVAPSGAPGAEPPPATQAPAAAPTATPEPWPTFGYRFVPRPAASPDPAAPQIVEVDLNSRRLHDRIAIRVLTNEVVTRVENHTNGRADIIPHTGPGEFIAVSKLPKLPFIVRGMTVDLRFVAFTADGRTASVKVPVQLD